VRVWKLAAFAATAGFVSITSAQQRSAVEEIERYRAALGDGNPAELWEARGEALWKEKRGPKGASLEKCDLGLGAGVVKGAYAVLPKYFADSGKVEMVGLSNANPEQIRLGKSVLGDALVSVQNQFSPAFRSSRPEIDVCQELGLAFLPWGPLGGLSSAKDLGDQHRAFAEVVDERGVSPQQVTLAWHLAQSPCVIPIPGAKRPSSIIDSAPAADLELTDEELARLDAS